VALAGSADRVARRSRQTLAVRRGNSAFQRIKIVRVLGGWKRATARASGLFGNQFCGLVSSILPVYCSIDDDA